MTETFYSKTQLYMLIFLACRLLYFRSDDCEPMDVQSATQLYSLGSWGYKCERGRRAQIRTEKRMLIILISVYYWTI